jgi:hypothetical protein
VLIDADRRGLTPVSHTNMTPYGEIQLRTDRRLNLTGVPRPRPDPGAISRPHHPDGHRERHRLRGGDVVAVYSDTIGYRIIDALRDAGLATTRRR